MANTAAVRRAEVFVVGGQPTITYNPRPTRGIESKVRDYLDERGRILCITGPSKSGKTVFVRHLVPRSIRLSGGDLGSVDAFWQEIVDELRAYTQEVAETSSESKDVDRDMYGGGLGSLAKAEHSDAKEKSATRRH